MQKEAMAYKRWVRRHDVVQKAAKELTKGMWKQQDFPVWKAKEDLGKARGLPYPSWKMKRGLTKDKFKGETILLCKRQQEFAKGKMLGI